VDLLTFEQKIIFTELDGRSEYNFFPHKSIILNKKKHIKKK